MATILLSAVGASLGAGFGGTVLGLSGAVIGRAIGATVGRVIDQKLLGAGSEAVDVGRVDRFRVMGASEGAAIPRIWGRVRVSGQVIWASRFQENVDAFRWRQGHAAAVEQQFQLFGQPRRCAVRRRDHPRRADLGGRQRNHARKSEPAHLQRRRGTTARSEDRGG